jgi:hypothetical protein
MSVLIKGMEMPQKCGQCKLYHAERPMHCMAVEGHRTVGAPYGMPRPDWCPLVELPVPHGRLIDADAVINELASEHVGGLEAIKKYTGADTWTSGLHTAWRTIDDADTIIEAEE